VAATLGSFFAYTTRQGWTVTSAAAGLERRHLRAGREDHDRTRAIDEDELLAFLGANHPLRDKTLWWMLYETAARANEILSLDVADLDLGRRRAVMIGKGGRPELVGWETKTARLLPRHLHGRRNGPLFLADIAPVPARQPALADIDPGSGRARLSYRRAAEVFKVASGGRTLHQLRHSRLTHLAESGIQLPILVRLYAGGVVVVAQFSASQYRQHLPAEPGRLRPQGNSVALVIRGGEGQDDLAERVNPGCPAGQFEPADHECRLQQPFMVQVVVRHSSSPLCVDAAISTRSDTRG
jgi:site-specific recombinase XerC